MWSNLDTRPIRRAACRAHNAVQAVQASGRETKIKRTTVVKLGGDKRMDKGGCGSTGNVKAYVNKLVPATSLLWALYRKSRLYDYDYGYAYSWPCLRLLRRVK